MVIILLSSISISTGIAHQRPNQQGTAFMRQHDFVATVLANGSVAFLWILRCHWLKACGGMSCLYNTAPVSSQIHFLIPYSQIKLPGAWCYILSLDVVSLRIIRIQQCSNNDMVMRCNKPSNKSNSTRFPWTFLITDRFHSQRISNDEEH